MWANPYHIDYYFSNLLWKRTPLQVSFLQTDWSAQLAEEKSRALETWYNSKARLPAASSVQPDMTPLHGFHIISASSSLLCTLHSLSPFRCHNVSGAARSAGVHVYWKWTRRYSIYFETVIQSADRLLFPGATWLHGHDGRVAGEFRINLQVIAGVAVFYFPSLWGLFVFQRTFEELVLLKSTMHEVSDYQNFPQSIVIPFSQEWDRW